MKQIQVSICCIAFNHEKYIEKTIEGFLNQKTNFNYEILIHDDASTDHTTEIIKRYEKLYPEIISVIYQKENQYSKGNSISWNFLYPKARGKYIALCEGDDYWCDEYKLQKQFNCLEEHSNCVFCTHTVKGVKEDGSETETIYPGKLLEQKIISSFEWIKLMMNYEPLQFQTSSYFFKASIVKKHDKKTPDFIKKAKKVGDLPLLLLGASEGDLYYINEIMSCYTECSVGSWSENFIHNNQMKIQTIKSLQECFNLYNQFTEFKYSDYIKRRLEREEFRLLIITKNYKALRETRFLALYSQLSAKEKIYYRLFGQFPKLHRWYLNRKGK